MNIEEIYNNDEISVRSLNLCRYNGLHSVKELMEYFKTHYSFLKLRNCGRRSNEELTAVCEKYLSNFEKENETKEISVENLIPNLNRLQREVINNFVEVNANGLSVRSKNALSKYLNGNFKIKNLLEKKIFSKSFKFINIENIGARSIQELSTYISTVKDFILEVSKTDDEKHLIYLKNRFMIQATFSISNIPADILSSESIFQLTEFLIDSNLLFNENHTLIFKKGINLYNNQIELTTEEISEEANLTRERVRQIRKECIDELHEKLLFIKNFQDDLFQKYSIDVSSNYIEINNDLVLKINKINDTNFSKEFISYILFVYVSKNFFVIGNIEDILVPKQFNNRNRHNWNNFFIIKKQFSKIDFTLLSNDINERINERIEETYAFNFKSYLSKFISELEIDIINLVFPIAEKIINDEFGLYLDLDDNIIFKKNTLKQSYEYSYEALEILGKPSKVSEILEKIVELYPNYKSDERKVATSMKRKDGFVPVGRSSVFGLKKWEDELEDFKGGTIRSIATGYLKNFVEPKHISDITDYVLRYRPESNLKSIFYNLRMDDSQIFVFFINSYIGLKEMRYSGKFELLQGSHSIEKKSWDERYKEVVDFLKVNCFLPNYNSPDSFEKTLWRWVNNQKHSKKLSLDRQELINKILK